MPMDSPSIKTSAWSARVMGLVRKKKPSVMWKSEREVTIVLADMSAMIGFVLLSQDKKDSVSDVVRRWFRFSKRAEHGKRV